MLLIGIRFFHFFKKLLSKDCVVLGGKRNLDGKGADAIGIIDKSCFLF